MKNKKIALHLLVCFVIVLALVLGFAVNTNLHNVYADFTEPANITFTDYNGENPNITVNVNPSDTLGDIKTKLIAMANWDEDTSITLSFDGVEFGASSDDLIYSELDEAYLTATDKCYSATFPATAHIDFTPIVSYTGNYTQVTTNDTLLLEGNEQNIQVTVRYKVVYNDGVNSLLLIPTYDHSVFSISSILVNENALGEATITGTEVDADVIKIALESDTTYSGVDGTNTALLTIVYNVNASMATDGDYTFGLELPEANESLDNYNNTSKANVFLDGNQLGEQKNVQINIVVNNENVVKILKYRDAQIEIGYNFSEDTDYWYNFIYTGSEINTNKVTTFDYTATLVEYTFNGSADTIIKWYSEEGDELGYVPTTVGNYIVGISANAHGIYHQAAEVRRVVKILPVQITVVIDEKTSVYLDPIKALTANYSAEQLEAWGYQLVSSVQAGSPVGSYTISLVYVTDEFGINHNYNITSTSATYTITPREITITALDQNAPYTGEEPVVDQTKYTFEGVDSLSGVVITKASGVNVGEYTLTPSLNNNNYVVTAVTGKFYITSIGVDAEYIYSFFTGDTVVYDTNSHNLLIVDNNTPEWILNNYVASNNIQVNANTYTISISLTLDELTASNYTNGVREFNSTVTGKITPYALIITADDCTSVYGETPVTLTPTTVNGLGNDVINVSFVVKDGEEIITLSATTPVGNYIIVPSATDTNYSYTYNNGTYQITKATPVITIDANDVYYNRALDYTTGAKVNTLTLNGYTVVIKNSDGIAVDANSVLDAGEYTVVVTVDGTDNYNSASKSETFVINKIALANPTVEYNHGTATWSVVTTDTGNVALYGNPTLTYTINGVEQEGNSYTAVSTNAITLVVSSSNSNYLDATVNFYSVYTVDFAEGTHTANQHTPDNMPAVQYVFAGELAVQPQSNPTLEGYTFNHWNFDFATEIEANTTIVAVWDINSYTITFKYTADAETLNIDVFEFAYNYNDKITYADLNLVPVMSSSNAGVYYTYNGEWISDLLTYIVDNNGKLANNDVEFVVVGNATFVAQYDTNYNSFTLTYYVSENGGEYVQYGQPVNVVYLNEIQYIEFATDINWFKADGWYANTATTQQAPKYMPNGNINVYGKVVFDIGQGDINGDGLVNTNDITLYRQWIVGGYNVTPVTVGTEWATAQDFDTEARYFLVKVADNNEDTSKDIRDVSITRMAIVGGYTWDLETGYNVTGQEIIRNVNSSILHTIDDAIRAGKKITLTGDITDVEGIIDITTNNNVEIDLGGHTLTVQYLKLVSTSRSTITVKNGTIITTDGITISAPYGNVVLSNVVGYDAEGEINLAAANHSLHINGLVKFNKGTEENSVPADVKVEKDTHIVIEEAANIVVEKLIVTENFVQTESNEATITIKNNSTLVDEIEVVGNILNDNTIGSYEDLKAACIKGGVYTLTADITYSGKANRIYVYNDTELNLNGHAITSTNEVALAVVDGATLTINGEGNVNAQEGCVMAFGNSSIVINGGTYTCSDNFVIGTNGSTGKGGNTITINGGTFNGNIVSNGYVACGVYVANDDVVVINGGTFNITGGVGVLARSGNTTIGEDVVFNVTGNGTLGKVGDSKVTVPSGEAIVLDRAAGYPGGMPTLTNNGSYSVYIIGNINDVNSLIYARNNGGHYTLTGDVIYSGQVSFAKDTTIDLNNHTLRSTNNVALSAVDGATLTIKGNGNVIAQEMCVMAFDGSNVVINGGTYTAYDNAVFGTNGSTGRGGNTITLNAGTYNGNIVTNGYIACGVYVANDDVVVINGGTFNITGGVGVLARSGNTTIGENVIFNVTGNGAYGKVGDSKVTIPSGEVIVVDKTANYPGGLPTLVNNSEYAVYTKQTINNLSELKAAAENGGDYTLMADITYSAPDYVIFANDAILNLNGYTLRSTNDVALRVVNGATLTINGNGNVIAQEACVMAFSNSSVVINGGTYTSYDNFVVGTNGSTGKGGNTITINGGTFNGNIQTAGYVACGVYVANSDTVAINGGTFNIAGGVGVLARSGNTTVGSNVVFNVTGDGNCGKVGDSRVVIPSGEILVLDEVANYPAGAPTLTNNSSYSVYETINNVA